MPLNAPKLDTRTFDDLVAEARQRIPRYAPEWTNLNDSDPGMTLVKLNAWLTETILFELNRVPRLNYVKFLDLLQIKPRAARAATTQLLVKLKRLDKTNDPLTVLVPLGAKVAVDDSDLDREVLFETDYTLVAINAAIGAVIAPRGGELPLDLVTEFDDKTAETTWLHSFQPFGPVPGKNAALVLGLVLRPHLKGKLDDYSQDVWPAGLLDIYVDAAQPFDLDPDGALLSQAESRKCLFPWQVGERAGDLDWQVYIGSAPAEEMTADGGDDDGWRSLSVAVDETAGLTRSGHVQLAIPEQITRASFDQLSRAFWNDLGLSKPPSQLAELLEDLRNGPQGLKDALEEAVWAQMGLPEEHFNAVLKCCPDGSQDKCGSGADVADAVDGLADDVKAMIDPGALTPAEWVGLEAGYEAPAAPAHLGAARRLYWVRALLKAEDAAPALLSAIRLNSVPATATATRVDERLGTSNGRPGQQLTLSKTPIYFDPAKGEMGGPDLDLDLTEDQTTRAWTRVDDFYAAAPDAEVYTLDETSGQVTFGDGIRGRIPGAGALIRAARYRAGGGAIGNVGPGSITKLKGALRHVDGVTNPRAAANGSDAESLDEVILRAPHSLRARDRAVSRDDFTTLAMETPGVALHKAYALAGRAYDKDALHKFQPRAGAVTLVVLPANLDEETPQPGEAQLRAICAHLEPRRLITTELYIAGPEYVRLSHLSATLRIERDADIKAVSDAAAEAVLDYLHPLRGGKDKAGWPFGESIYHADVYELFLGLAGVRRVADLSLGLEGQHDSDAALDVLGLPEGHLPHLLRDLIALKVIYDEFG